MLLSKENCINWIKCVCFFWAKRKIKLNYNKWRLWSILREFIDDESSIQLFLIFFSFISGSRWTKSCKCPPPCWHVEVVSRTSGTGSSWKPSSNTGTRTAWAATCAAVVSERWAVASTTSWEENYVDGIIWGWSDVNDYLFIPLFEQFIRSMQI